MIRQLSLGEDLCRALNLTASRVHHIHIDVTVGELATVTAGMYLDDSSLDDVFEYAYLIVPRATWPAPDASERVT